VSAYQAAPTNLVDILDRVLDKGLVVAGDIRISLANVELLTVRIRLLVCSIDKAEQIGLNWWRYDHTLVHPAAPAGELPAGTAGTPREEDAMARLEARLAALEQQLAAPQAGSGAARTAGPRQRRRTRQGTNQP
jgi:hypothetical protein